MVTVAGLLADLPVFAHALRDSTLIEESSTKILEQGLRQTEVLQNMKANIAKQFRTLKQPTVGEIRWAADVLENGRLLSKLFSPTYRKARKFYRALAQTDGAQRKRNPGQELQKLAEFFEQKREFESNPEFRRLSGVHFRGLDTQWKELLTVSRWASKVRRELPDKNPDTAICRETLLRGSRLA